MIPQSELISPAYRESQRVMHANPRGYGGRGYVWAPTVIEIARRYDVGSILDYGAGQGTLGASLRYLTAEFAVREYDPAIERMAALPTFADMVTCCDVLEHIEPEKLDTVLTHIRKLARRVVFLVVACRPANKLLPNGENAHLIIESKQWWQARIEGAGFVMQAPPTVLPEKLPGKGKCWYGVVTP